MIAPSMSCASTKKRKSPPHTPQLAQGVVGGGLLVEGTSDPFGRLWVANVLRRHPVQARWLPEALVFSTNFRTGFAPMDFPPVLPKSYIHRMIPGEPIYAFFEKWQQAARLALPERIWGVRRWFCAAALHLAESGVEIDLRPWWIRHGYLVVRMPLAGASG
ncbi:MAG: hypothetical protein IPK16_03290 [Anaerolineales bacterium]|nr:hypothetical protein [Anaerolineales bacterium]